MYLNNSLKVANQVVELLWEMEPRTNNFGPEELEVVPFKNNNSCGLSIVNKRKNLQVNIQSGGKTSNNIKIRYGKSDNFRGNAGPNMFKTKTILFNSKQYRDASQFCLTYLNDGVIKDEE